MVSFLVLFVRTMTPWMSWSSCRYAYLFANFKISLLFILACMCFWELYMYAWNHLMSSNCLVWSRHSNLTWTYKAFKLDLNLHWLDYVDLSTLTVSCIYYIQSCSYMFVHVYIALNMTDELNPTNGLQNNVLIVESCKPAWYILALQILTGASSSWMLSSG